MRQDPPGAGDGAGSGWETYPDGVWLAELAPLSDPALLPRTVAASIDVPEQVGRPPDDVLANYFENKNLLLVLDNCEHLVDAVARPGG